MRRGSATAFPRRRRPRAPASLFGRLAGGCGVAPLPLRGAVRGQQEPEPVPSTPVVQLPAGQSFHDPGPVQARLREDTARLPRANLRVVRSPSFATHTALVSSLPPFLSCDPHQLRFWLLLYATSRLTRFASVLHAAEDASAGHCARRALRGLEYPSKTKLNAGTAQRTSQTAADSCPRARTKTATTAKGALDKSSLPWFSRRRRAEKGTPKMLEMTPRPPRRPTS